MDTAICNVTILLLIQRSITLLYSYWYSNLFTEQLIRHSNRTQLGATIIPSSSSHSIPRLAPATTQGRRKHSKDAHALGEDERTPSPTDVIYCLSMSFYCYVIYAIYATCAIWYPQDGRPHKPQGRASDISTISTRIYLCNDILPIPHQSRVLVYLCGF
jgi:hypothetical protein